MSTEVIVAIISLIGVVLSAVLSLNLTNYRLSKIEEQLQKHNQYADKIGNIQTDIAVIKTDIEYIKGRKGE